jgi:hypothetical protein
MTPEERRRIYEEEKARIEAEEAQRGILGRLGDFAKDWRAANTPEARPRSSGSGSSFGRGFGAGFGAFMGWMVGGLLIFVMAILGFVSCVGMWNASWKEAAKAAPVKPASQSAAPSAPIDDTKCQSYADREMARAADRKYVDHITCKNGVATIYVRQVTREMLRTRGMETSAQELHEKFLGMAVAFKEAGARTVEIRNSDTGELLDSTAPMPKSGAAPKPCLAAEDPAKTGCSRASFLRGSDEPAAQGSVTPAPVSGVLLDVQGTGTKRTKTFTVTDDATLSYAYTCGDETWNFSVMRYKAGESLPDVDVNELKTKNTDSTELHDRGAFYLDISGGPCNWHVIVRQ